MSHYVKRATVLLNVARITSGKLMLEPVACDLADLVRSVAGTFAEPARHAGSPIGIDAPTNLPGTWDPLAMEQIIDNLISNAIKYGGPRPIDVRVEDLGDTVRLSVRDHGPGISAESRARIFARFERAVGTEESRSGFGVGLWVVGQLVEAMEGMILVDDAPGGGAVFTVTAAAARESNPLVSGHRDAVLERFPSGIPGLDVILNGGFLKGGLYIIQGPPGTGKTILGNQLCFNHIRGGGRALYITLLAEYHARMMQHLSIMSFFDSSKIPDQLAYLNGLRELHDNGLKGLLDLLRREITTRDASVLVIDGIVGARRAVEDEQAFNEFVRELQAVAIATECTVFVLTSAQGSRITPEHTMVDGIIELVDQLSGWAAESSLQVVKFRGSSVLRGRHAFKITDDGIVVHPRIEALLARPSHPDSGGGAKVPSGVDQLDIMLDGGLPGLLHHHDDGTIGHRQDNTWATVSGQVQRGRAWPDVRFPRNPAAPRRQDRWDLPAHAVP